MKTVSLAPFCFTIVEYAMPVENAWQPLGKEEIARKVREKCKGKISDSEAKKWTE